MMPRRLFATGLLLASLSFSLPAFAAAPLSSGIEQHFIAPSASGTALSAAPPALFRNEQGKEVLLKELLAASTAPKALLVSFWARWCAPCVHELPSLADFASTQNKIAVILISEEAIPAAIGKAFLERRHIDSIPLYSDSSGDAARLLGVQGLPASILFGSDGHEIGRVLGPVNWSHPDTRLFLESKI